MVMIKKTKLTEDAVVVDQEPANTLPAKMPVFAAAARPSYEVEANFDEVETYLKGVEAKYKDLVLTEKDFDQAKVIKTELVSMRTSLTKIQTDVKKERFNAPKAIFDAKMDALIAIGVKVEKVVDVVINKRDQARIDELTMAFDAYKENFITFYSLEPEYAARIEYKEKYYNKTAVEKESKDDIEAQVKALKAEQVARTGSVRLITKALASSPEINLEAQIEKLDSGVDVASILEWIETEQERLLALKNAPKSGGGGGVVIGVRGAPENSEDYLPEDDADEESEEEETPVQQRIMDDAEKIDYKTDFPGKTKSLSVTITYPNDTGDALTALFKMLSKYGITTKVNK